MSLYELHANSLTGKPQSLADHRGKVALVVNVASECGFTPQYAGLETLWNELRDRGLVILGFPSNEFGAQEPGSGEQIESFCQKNYGVTFPLFEKIETKGPGQSPVYAFLTAQHGEPKWNFHKYLVGRDGQVITAFPSTTAPDSKSLRKVIDEALAQR